MLTYVGYRMRVTLQDSRSLIGTFMAFDKHMNIVLGDCEEYRRIKNKKGSGVSEEKEEKRTLGLIILRGDAVVSLSIEGPPPPEQSDKLTPGGPGVGKAMGRGMPSVPLTGAPVGLAGAMVSAHLCMHLSAHLAFIYLHICACIYAYFYHPSYSVLSTIPQTTT